MERRSEFRFYMKPLGPDWYDYGADLVINFPDFLDVGTSKLQCRMREYHLTTKFRFYEWPCSSIWLNPTTPGTLNVNSGQRFFLRHISWRGYWVNINVEYEVIISTIDENDFVGLLNMNENTIGTPNYNNVEKSWMADLYLTNGGCRIATPNPAPPGCVPYSYYWFRHYERFYHFMGRDQINLNHFYYTTG
jgi:hypothetical protein